MNGRKTIRTDEPDYYRRDTRSPAPTAASVTGPKTPGPRGPVPDGVVWGEANVATVGPLRALTGREVVEVIVPSAVTPAGVANNAVQLAKNDFQTPMYVRVRLARNGTEGRMIVSKVSAVKGAGNQPGEWIDLTVQPGRFFEALLLNGESLYGIGSWPGIVPVQINVTVAKWTP